jgi:hypothetical protein
MRLAGTRHVVPRHSCAPGMGDSLEVKVLCGRCSDEAPAEGRCVGVNQRDKEQAP